MKLHKVLQLRQQSAKNAARHLAAAEEGLSQVEQQIGEITQMMEEYALQMSAGTSAYQLKQRQDFFAQLWRLKDEQRRHLEHLQEALIEQQEEFKRRRADEKLLAKLIAKREADHEYWRRKKLEGAQVVRPQTKL